MSSRFNVGDKVRILSSPPNFDSDPALINKMRDYLGKEVTIASYVTDYPTWCTIKEDNGLYFWDDRWFEPVKKEMITITFDPSDKVTAHKMVEEAIKNYYAPKDWTEKEVEQAKELVCEMASTIIREGGDLSFAHDDDNSITCIVYNDSFSWEPTHDFYAKPHGKDIYNVWIGKCVALCKALKKPIPDFIRYKNT